MKLNKRPASSGLRWMARLISVALIFMGWGTMAMHSAHAYFDARPQLLSSDLVYISEPSPYVYDFVATDSQANTHVNVVFSSGTADYSVNGGVTQSLISGVNSASIALGTGSTAASRLTTIVVTHHGATDQSYTLRAFRMPTFPSLSYRDKANPSVAITPTSTTSTGDFSQKETFTVGHLVSQMEFSGSAAMGQMCFWSGCQSLTSGTWFELNWSACCLFRDGSNTWLPDSQMYYKPFKGSAALNGVGDGPALNLQYEVSRLAAFDQANISSVVLSDQSATCSSSGTNCSEASGAPGNFEILAENSDATTHLSATFTSGSVTYSVNGGSSRSLTSGVQSSAIPLGSGTSVSSRITTIVVTHVGSVTSTYTLRIFRMPTFPSLSYRDKANPSSTLTPIAVWSTGTYSQKTLIRISHLVTQVEFSGSAAVGQMCFWSGCQSLTSGTWFELNWSACCLFRDGSNTWLPDSQMYYKPFKGATEMNGLGDGPVLNLQYEIDRADANNFFAVPIPTSSTTTTSTTSTTTTTTTTTTTLPPTQTTSTSTTTVSPSSGNGGGAISPVTTVATGQQSIETIAPQAAITDAATTTSTTTPQVIQKSSQTQGVVASSSTSTTVPADVVPTAPAVEPGSAQVVIGDKSVEAVITRENNSLVVSANGLRAVLSVLAADGTTLSLDSLGNLVLTSGKTLSLTLDGYAPNSVAEEWLFSTPKKLASVAIHSDGLMKSQVKIPNKLEVGNHRIVLRGTTPSGDSAVLAIGVVSSQSPKTSKAKTILIAIPIAFALVGGFILPAISWSRRRRRS